MHRRHKRYRHKHHAHHSRPESTEPKPPARTIPPIVPPMGYVRCARCLAWVKQDNAMEVYGKWYGTRCFEKLDDTPWSSQAKARLEEIGST